jgi:hypothetical protein
MKPNPNVYEQMSRQKLELAAIQINILTHYNPEGKERRVQELYDISHKSMIGEQSEKSIEEMENLIRRYKSEIKFYREKNPEIESSDKMMRKLEELRLINSCGL